MSRLATELHTSGDLLPKYERSYMANDLRGSLRSYATAARDARVRSPHDTGEMFDHPRPISGARPPACFRCEVATLEPANCLTVGVHNRSTTATRGGPGHEYVDDRVRRLGRTARRGGADLAPDPGSLPQYRMTLRMLLPSCIRSKASLIFSRGME